MQKTYKTKTEQKEICAQIDWIRSEKATGKHWLTYPSPSKFETTSNWIGLGFWQWKRMAKESACQWRYRRNLNSTDPKGHSRALSDRTLETINEAASWIHAYL